jgi:hypothetical protein
LGVRPTAVRRNGLKGSAIFLLGVTALLGVLVTYLLCY